MDQIKSGDASDRTARRHQKGIHQVKDFAYRG
jgi:hypothetical protein